MKSREYKSWSGAKNRCHNPRSSKFHEYGGRGISMCAAWRESFQRFLEDMGKRPAKHSLERLNVDGNYEPGNCVWATDDEQIRNKQNSIRVVWNGKSMILTDIARIEGVNYKSLYFRYRIQKHSLSEAIAGARLVVREG